MSRAAGELKGATPISPRKNLSVGQSPHRQPLRSLEPGADFKTFVVDTKGTLADHQALRAEQRLTEVYGNTKIQFIIRVEDGVLIIPPNGRFMPEGTL